MKCHELCKRHKVECPNKDCRLWIDYPEDFNCTLITVHHNSNLIFYEIGKRLKLTPSRIKQIETAALKKMKLKTNKMLNIL